MPTREDLHNVLRTCEAVLLAKNEEIDALKETIQLKDEALAEQDKLIKELALLLAVKEKEVAAVIGKAISRPSSPLKTTDATKTVAEDIDTPVRLGEKAER